MLSCPPQAWSPPTSQQSQSGLPVLCASVSPVAASSHLQLPQSCDLTVTAAGLATQNRKAKTRWTNASARLGLMGRWEQGEGESRAASVLEEGPKAVLCSSRTGCSPGASEGPGGASTSLCRSPPFSALAFGTALARGAMPGFLGRRTGWVWHYLPLASCPVISLFRPKPWLSHLTGKKEAGFFLRNSCQAGNGRKRAKDRNEGHRTGLPSWSLPSRAVGEIRHPRDTTTGKQWCREGIPEEAGPT